MEANSTYAIDWDLVNNPKSKTFEYLIGNSIDAFGRQLPREIDVLRRYYDLSAKISEPDKMSLIVKQIEDCYREGGIQTRSTEAIRIKIKRLLTSCKTLVAKRKICHKSDIEKKRHIEFKKNINTLFEVADCNKPLSFSQIEFLHDQRTQRTMQIDTIETTDNENSNSMHQNEPNQMQRGSDDTVSTPNGSSDMGFSDNSISSDDIQNNSEPDDSDPDSDYDPSGDENELLPHRKKRLPNDLLKEISKTKGSYRLCESLLKIGVQLSGDNPNDYTLSKTSLWKQITDLRSNEKNRMLESLAASNDKVIIQFDGKNYRRLNERHVGAEERIIVLCHTEESDIPLGLFSVESHTGIDCANKVLDAIEEHNLTERVIGLVCDTEAVNTGQFAGACTYIELILNMELLYLMCRHHVLEIVLKAVFETIFGATTGPNVTTFDILKDYWDQIKASGFVFNSIDSAKIQRQPIKRFVDEARTVITDHAEHLRNDYKELNDLSLKLLGVKTKKKFNVPGATNNARWMCRAIYALKLYLFRGQIDMDAAFVVLLERFSLFVSIIYVKYWNQSWNAADAPFNDIQLMKDLQLFAVIDQEISDAALVAFKRHLWYLSDELILLGLFSNKVSTQEKINMCAAIQQQVSDRTQNSIKHTDEIENILELNLNYFISDRSFFLLQQLNIDTTFILEDPAQWHEFESYRVAQKKVHDLIVVVNDSAERAIQLGIQLIDGQRVQTEPRLQDFIVSAYAK